MAFTVIAYVPYIVSIFRNRTKPNRTTWLVLFLIGAITFIVYRDAGAQATLGVALANVVGPLVVFILAIKFGEGWKGKGDFKYLVFSAIAIALWQLYDSPVIGLVFNLLADFIAFLPTIKKSFQEPWTEDLPTWCIFTLGGIINLLAIEQWQFHIVIYPLYILLAEGSVAGLLLWVHFTKNKDWYKIKS